MPAQTIAETLARATELAAVSDSARLDTELLLAEVLGKGRTYLFTWPERQLTPEQLAVFDALFSRRLQGEPVAYILGYQDFWTLRLKVSPATLIPRADTELLVEQALALLPDQPMQVADLGTGTGAIALALAAERPHWQVVAVDAVVEAVLLAEQNRCDCQLDNVQVQQGFWCEGLSASAFDLILSNPPYIDPHDPHLEQGDVRFEPRSALIAQQQGMADIALIAQQARQCLKPGGWLMLEHGYQQAGAVKAVLTESGYQQILTHQDLGGRDRVTVGQLPC